VYNWVTDYVSAAFWFLLLYFLC